jgi:predicted NAD/FAD-dependent oxidoreductase
MRIIVVGAGLSGLMAAQSLTRTGHDVTVFDKGRGVGGRLATRRIGDATLDHGAQFFTVRSEQFASHVNEWLAAGVVHEWCHGFDSEDGHPRYVGTKGMSGIAKHLAQGLDIRTSALVFSLERTAPGYNVITDDGVAHACDKVLLTAPIPQSFSLMFGGAIEMPEEMRTIDYDRTLGLLAVLDSNNHNVKSPGGMQFPDDVFSFIGDNSAKGISAAPALTFHANPEWSRQNFDRELDEIHSLLLTAARPWLGSAQILESQPKKWRFATPKSAWPDACWIDPSGTLALAGDAFAGPKMEGAALSGLAAANALLGTKPQN